MSALTLDVIQAKQTELAKLIQQFSEQAVAQSREIEIEDRTIVLAPGEHYAGAVLDAEGNHIHDLVLMAPKPEGKLTWQGALDWAKEIGGRLPNRQEQALLFANCKPHLKPEWHWSSEAHETESSYAWICHFDDGYQFYAREGYDYSAVSVRRL